MSAEALQLNRERGVCVIFLDTHSTQVEFAMGCRDFNRPTRKRSFAYFTIKKQK
jgi:hypothetical protein